MKQCSKCSIMKPLTAYYYNPHTPDNKMKICGECLATQTNTLPRKEGLTAKERRARSARNSQLKSSYGVDINWFEKKKEEQGEMCAICNRKQQQPNKDLCVDHDHNTGKIRDLLCDLCNQGLGCFGDDYEMLRKASKYLETHSLNNEKEDELK